MAVVTADVQGPFTRLWLATAVSALGDGVRYTAMPLLALTLTTDPMLLALVMVANTAPLLFSPFAGVLADVLDRRSLLIAVDLARTVVAAALALAVLTGVVNLALVCAAAALLGLGETVFVVAGQSFLPAVVPPDRLATANGRLHVAQLVFRDSVGQPVGGLLFVAAAAMPFLVDSASFLVGVVLLATISRAPTANGDRPSWRVMIADGVRYLRADRLLVTLAVMLGVLNFLIVGIVAIQVLYVVTWLGLPASVFGLVLASGALGGIAGGLLGGRLSERLGLFPAALAALALSGLASLALGLTRQPAVALVAFAALGFGTAVYQSLTVSFRQASVPSELLGRINGVYRLIGTGTAPVGALALGALAKATDLRLPYVVAGVGMVLLAAGTARPLLRMAAGR